MSRDAFFKQYPVNDKNFSKNGVHVEKINKNTSTKMYVCNTLTSLCENANYMMKTCIAIRLKNIHIAIFNYTHSATC